MDPEDAEYVCTLTPSSLEKAKKELNEDPQQRLSQVQTLRKWIKEQPHLASRTDTKFLLAMLRRSKFSQLKARELIENILTAKTMFPEMMSNIDIQDSKLLGFVDKGIFVHLPKPDSEGRRITIFRSGYVDLDNPDFTPVNEIKCNIAISEMMRQEDENICVNGWILVFDCTGIGAKHIARMPLEMHRKMSKIFQDSHPERIKAFHFYNAGAFFEVMMSMIRQFMKKKHQERVRVHETMESLYKVIPMELWPDDYLPDDYKGPSAGSIESLQAALKKRLLNPAMRAHILEVTGDKYKIDENKRSKDAVPNESFRKLNID